MRMVSSLRPVASDTIDYSYKSTNREELNDLFARRGKADDILIVKDGYLTDTCLTAQDRFKQVLTYFKIPYEE